MFWSVSFYFFGTVSVACSVVATFGFHPKLFAGVAAVLTAVLGVFNTRRGVEEFENAWREAKKGVVDYFRLIEKNAPDAKTELAEAHKRALDEIGQFAPRTPKKPQQSQSQTTASGR